MTVQLATRVDPKVKKTLDRIHEQTHIPIRQLTEKAIALLDDYYQRLQMAFDKGDVNSHFMALVEKSLEAHGKTYEKLAK